MKHKHTSTGGRPAGELRQARADAARKLEAQRLASAHRGATWRDLAAQAGVGYSAAKATVHNMARAGELQRLPHTVRTAHSRRPMALYAPAQPCQQVAAGGSGFEGLQRAWGMGLAR